MTIHRIRIKMNHESRMLMLTEVEYHNLLNAENGKRFILLAGKNYNLNLIEYWWEEVHELND